MKKVSPCFFALFFLLPVSKILAQTETYQENNRWGLKSIGFFATYGGEKFFEPLTFAYFAQNSGNNYPKYFAMPPGAGTSQTRPLDDVPPLGLGFQLAWPVGKRHNEIRAGFAFQDHNNYLSANSRYNISPDTIRLHSVSINDEYVISQASFDYVFYTKPLLGNVRLLGRLGSTFGVSTRHDYTHTEIITDIDTADFFVSQSSNSYGYDPRKVKMFYQRTNIDSSPRLEAGVRASVGLEIILNIFHQKIGFSGEYGHGLAAQKVLKGGTTDYKRTELGHLQVRLFLR